jgi:outer membrane biosynthesis protein TonB
MTLREERKKEQRRVATALAVSLLIHLLLLCAFLVFLSMKPALQKRAIAPKPEPVELTMIPPPEPPKPTPKPQKEFIDSSQSTMSEKKPEHADFESDQNSLAASQLPPQSTEQVPTLEGEKSPEISLQARDLILGPSKQPSPPTPASPAREAQPPTKEQAKPEPTPPEKQKETKEAKPTPTPKPTPRPEDSELAMLDPSRPKPKPPEPKEEVRKPKEPSRPSVPRPPGFQPQERVTRLTGGISNRGPASMNAVATPLGRYKKMLSDAIGSRWYYYIQDMLDLVNVGTVQLRFVVRADGKVEGVKVLQNSSNESLASCSVRAIIEAEIPPIPKDVAAALAGNKLEVDYSFTIIGQ